MYNCSEPDEDILDDSPADTGDVNKVEVDELDDDSIDETDTSRDDVDELEE